VVPEFELLILELTNTNQTTAKRNDVRDFHSVAENSRLLGCNFVSLDEGFPTFLSKALLSSSRHKLQSFLDYLMFEDEGSKILRNAETRPPTQHHILEELSPLLNPTS
jgi:hypothetical protein